MVSLTPENCGAGNVNSWSGTETKLHTAGGNKQERGSTYRMADRLGGRHRRRVEGARPAIPSTHMGWERRRGRRLGWDAYVCGGGGDTTNLGLDRHRRVRRNANGGLRMRKLRMVGLNRPDKRAAVVTTWGRPRRVITTIDAPGWYFHRYPWSPLGRQADFEAARAMGAAVDFE